MLGNAKYIIRSLAAAVLWTASLSLVITGTWNSEGPTMTWGVYLGIAASTVTLWIVADCAAYRERVRVDHVVKTVVAHLEAEADIPHI